MLRYACSKTLAAHTECSGRNTRQNLLFFLVKEKISSLAPFFCSSDITKALSAALCAFETWQVMLVP
jgi:hypothetical protein